MKPLNHPRNYQLLLIFLASNLAGNEISEDYLRQNWYETEIILFSYDSSSQSGVDEAEAIHLTQQRFFDRDITFHLREKTSPASRTNPDIMTDLLWFRNTLSNSQLIDKPNWLLVNTTKRNITNEKEPEFIQTPTLDSSGLVPIIEISPAPTLTNSTEHELRLQAWTNILQSRSFIWETDELTLTTEARKLGRKGVKIIQHGKWIQSVPSRENPQKALIQLGESSSTDFQVEGYLSVTKSRFLHFEAKLWLSAITSSSSINTKNLGHAVIHESRRMRSKELHYIDHPLFGLLVTIRPIPIPSVPTESTTMINNPANNLY